MLNKIGITVTEKSQLTDIETHSYLVTTNILLSAILFHPHYWNLKLAISSN